jgi:glycosyltransferase involved in cell wall biosynthesis
LVSRARAGRTALRRKERGKQTPGPRQSYVDPVKILLLTDIPPCTNFTAGIVLDQLCSFLPKGSLACYTVAEKGLDPLIPSEYSSVAFARSQKPRENWRGFPGRAGSLASLAMDIYTRRMVITKLVKDIVKFGQEFGAGTLWCVLQGQTMIRLALPVSCGMGVSLRTNVWDPPGWWLRHRGVDRITRKRVLLDFERVLRASATCGAASLDMAAEYQNRFGTNTVAFLPSLSANLSQTPASRMHDCGDYVIGMAGQIYATAEWKALIAALDSVNWSILGRAVKITLMGRSLSLYVNGKSRVEFLGWRSQEETIQILSEADVLYCPYWFDPLFETEARLSFPSKLTAYLAAGRPVLFHGPRYASPARFLEEYRAGVCCHSLAPHDIIQKLSLLASDEQLYAQVTQNGRTAFEKNLTLSNLRHSFAKFLQVDASLLTLA